MEVWPVFCFDISEVIFRVVTSPPKPQPPATFTVTYYAMEMLPAQGQINLGTKFEEWGWNVFTPTSGPRG